MYSCEPTTSNFSSPLVVAPSKTLSTTFAPRSCTLCCYRYQRWKKKKSKVQSFIAFLRFLSPMETWPGSFHGKIAKRGWSTGWTVTRTRPRVRAKCCNPLHGRGCSRRRHTSNEHTVSPCLGSWTQWPSRNVCVDCLLPGGGGVRQERRQRPLNLPQPRRCFVWQGRVPSQRTLQGWLECRRGGS